MEEGYVSQGHASRLKVFWYVTSLLVVVALILRPSSLDPAIHKFLSAFVGIIVLALIALHDRIAPFE